MSYKDLNAPVEYPSRECEHDIKESEGNMFNSIFKDNVLSGNIQGVAHLQIQNYLVTESLNVEFKMKRTAIKITIIATTLMMKILMKYNFIKEIVKGAHNDTQHQNSTHPRTSPACNRLWWGAAD